MWRRDPRIINLYDKPVFPRPRPKLRSSTSSTLGTTLLLCSMIAVGTVGFLGAYGVIVHRESIFVPVIAEEAKPVQFWDVSGEAPKPDMHSSAVMTAEADVVSAQRAAQAATPEPSALIEKKAEAPPKKKKVHVVRRPMLGTALGFAAAPSFYNAPAPFGGW